ncbi:MAG: nucleoid-associated protein [Alphaproteobacteria bacterium]|nr:nucleoid-associated protein [Alphaproteobacteria bacterium]MBQ3606628.1 nucleoid-associated protein [Muribaculaceae bacterium]
MIQINEAIISKIICHRVCNDELKSIISDDTIAIANSDDGKIFTEILLKPFQNSEMVYEFYHEIDLNLNVIYKIAQDIYNGGEFVRKSQDIVSHLVKSSRYPNIKDGDLLIATFEDVVVENKYCEAICICKIEDKVNFIEPDYQNLQKTRVRKGISANKIDKACLIIFNQDNTIVCTTDKNRIDTQYWIEDFLSVRPKQNEYYNTKNMLTATRVFVTKEMPQVFSGVSKADQADILNKSVNFFKDNNTFDINEFTNDVMPEPELKEQFNDFLSLYSEREGVELVDHFDISTPAVKKQARVFKNVIKLDKNFHIYIHGDRKLIEQGEDEKGKYYKVYFKEEL